MKNGLMEKTRKVLTAIIVFVMMTFAVTWPTMTHAAELSPIKNSMVLASAAKSIASTSTPYKDVTVKTVGNEAYSAIKYIKAHKGFQGLFTGKKFYPNKKITRRQFLTCLGNLYGSRKVPVTYADVKNANRAITAEYACSKMVTVAKRLGIGMKWVGSKTVTLTRSGAAVYIKIFIDFDRALRPK